MRVLFIAPIPPPVTGHSLASGVLLDALREGHSVDLVDISKRTFAQGLDSPGRVLEVLSAFWKVLRFRPRAERIYLTVSESLAGNIKDLVIYALCVGKLDRTFIHLHGGTIGDILFRRHPGLAAVNGFFMRRLGGAIVTGDSHRSIFSRWLPPDRIHVVRNFAQDALFLDEREIERKFGSMSPLRVLFMGGMMREKGFAELLDGYLSLADEERSRVRLDFAGLFDSDAERRAFESRISGARQVFYHGHVEGEAKRRLFFEAHALCLPTAFLEGQPVSILEAYSSGCAVFAPDRGGIRDVFAPGVNGIGIEPRSPASAAEALRRALDSPGDLKRCALHNRGLAAEKFREVYYRSSMTAVLTGERRSS